MNCSNCGTLNNAEAKFCVRCGQRLGAPQPKPKEDTSLNNNYYGQMPNNQNLEFNNYQYGNNVNQTSSNNFPINQNSNVSTNVSFKENLLIIISVLLKPYDALKKQFTNISEFKSSAILSLLVTIMATLLKLVTTVLNTVMIKKYSYSSGTYTTTWLWKNLKEIKYLQIISKNFLIYIGVIVAIESVYYIVSLIFKKQSKFANLLKVAALSVVPFLICTLLLAPLLTIIWAQLSLPVTIIGAVYTVILIYEGMNNEIEIEENGKYYFNLICLSILGIIAYYLYTKFLMTSITGGLEDIMDLFK